MYGNLPIYAPLWAIHFRGLTTVAIGIGIKSAGIATRANLLSHVSHLKPILYNIQRSSADQLSEMSSFKLGCLAVPSLRLLASASPCPYGSMAECGELSQTCAKKFFAALAYGSPVVEDMIHDNRKWEFTQQEMFYERQLDLGELLFGGGLLNGILQPFTDVLSALDGKQIVFILFHVNNTQDFQCLLHKNSLSRRSWEMSPHMNSTFHFPPTFEECARHLTP